MYQSNTALVIVGLLTVPLDLNTSRLQPQQNTRDYIIAQPHSHKFKLLDLISALVTEY